MCVCVCVCLSVCLSVCLCVCVCLCLCQILEKNVPFFFVFLLSCSLGIRAENGVNRVQEPTRESAIQPGKVHSTLLNVGKIPGPTLIEMCKIDLGAFLLLWWIFSFFFFEMASLCAAPPSKLNIEMLNNSFRRHNTVQYVTQ